MNFRNIQRKWQKVRDDKILTKIEDIEDLKKYKIFIFDIKNIDEQGEKWERTLRNSSLIRAEWRNSVDTNEEQEKRTWRVGEWFTGYTDATKGGVEFENFQYETINVGRINSKFSFNLITKNRLSARDLNCLFYIPELYSDIMFYISNGGLVNYFDKDGDYIKSEITFTSLTDELEQHGDIVKQTILYGSIGEAYAWPLIKPDGNVELDPEKMKHKGVNYIQRDCFNINIFSTMCFAGRPVVGQPERQPDGSYVDNKTISRQTILSIAEDFGIGPARPEFIKNPVFDNTINIQEQVSLLLSPYISTETKSYEEYKNYLGTLSKLDYMGVLTYWKPEESDPEINIGISGHPGLAKWNMKHYFMEYGKLHQSTIKMYSEAGSLFGKLFRGIMGIFTLGLIDLNYHDLKIVKDNPFYFWGSMNKQDFELCSKKEASRLQLWNQIKDVELDMDGVIFMNYFNDSPASDIVSLKNSNTRDTFHLFEVEEGFFNLDNTSYEYNELPAHYKVSRSGYIIDNLMDWSFGKNIVSYTFYNNDAIDGVYDKGGFAQFTILNNAKKYENLRNWTTSIAFNYTDRENYNVRLSMGEWNKPPQTMELSEEEFFTQQPPATIKGYTGQFYRPYKEEWLPLKIESNKGQLLEDANWNYAFRPINWKNGLGTNYLGKVYYWDLTFYVKNKNELWYKLTPKAKDANSENIDWINKLPILDNLMDAYYKCKLLYLITNKNKKIKI